MLFQITISSLALAFTVSSTLAARSPFKWESCGFDGEAEATVKYECSSFLVPLDYLDSAANKTLNLQVTRVPAVNGDSQGSIFFNFGGPGFGAREALVGMAEQLLVITEGKYDLVGWDPRGVATTSPFKCYSDAERPVVMQKHRVNDAFGPEDRTALARMWASAGNVANDCLNSKEQTSGMGELIGTGYLARDLMRLNDALEGPDSLLNYWGISYGTILGATVAAMFPDRMGRVMLDGNVNVPQWYNGYDTIWWSDVDNAVFDYFDRCVKAGPGLCPLAARNESADVLTEDLYRLMDELRRLPIPLGGATVLDASAFKLVFRAVLYGNTLWPTFATILSELFKPADQRNIKAISSIWLPVVEATDTMGSLKDESLFGIYCGDKNTRTDSFEDIFAVSEELKRVSKALGEVHNNLVYLCARWPFHAKGGWESSWNETIETANPMLFVGPRYDPVTPISNAYNNSGVFVGSGVLTHGGIGHGVTSHPSLCTAKAIRAYFRHGELPAEDLNCTADHDAFDTSKTWKDSYLPELSWE
ncbi:hypothetical protein QIS74_01530 [Colletotrichum tabaci]|uniref:Peptidase S33 tripeptidyl aminopeptidase-like C-terminal domain-containing protein n=1 Tax=Colletotrichum tabaci TaxID=1209068 RepID=A0AAV9TR03_9PEZI